MPGKTAVPVSISTKMHPTPHMSNDVVYWVEPGVGMGRGGGWVVWSGLERGIRWDERGVKGIE